MLIRDDAASVSCMTDQIRTIRAIQIGLTGSLPKHIDIKLTPRVREYRERNKPRVTIEHRPEISESQVCGPSNVMSNIYKPYGTSYAARYVHRLDKTLKRPLLPTIDTHLTEYQFQTEGFRWGILYRFSPASRRGLWTVEHQTVSTTDDK